MKYARIIILLAIVSLISSCLTFPLPDHKDQINQLKSQIAIGVTSREQVILIMGKPDFSKDRWIIYTRRMYEGRLLFVGLSPTPAYSEFMDLYFEFDSNGTLNEFRTDKYDMIGQSDKQIWDLSKSDKSREDTVEEACDSGLESCN